jgi:nucleoside-diphosphate-sugar epimerase
MSRHLITGGAGFIGSALAHRLVKEGHFVTVLDRFSRGKAERLPSEVRTIRGDIRDAPLVRRAVRGADVIWHLAYIQGTQTFYADPKDVIDVALRGIMNVLGACDEPRREKPELFLVSSSEAYQTPPEGMFPTDERVPLSIPDPTNPRYSYATGKIASEVATLAYSQAGILNRAIIVRPHNVIGADMGEDHVVPQIARRVQALEGDELEIQGDGRATRCFNYIDDAIDGLMVLFDRGEDRNVYHLGDPREEIPIGQLALRIARYYGRMVTLKPSELPKGSPMRRMPDITKLRALGYEPRVGLDEALAKTLEWYTDEASLGGVRLGGVGQGTARLGEAGVA